MPGVQAVISRWASGRSFTENEVVEGGAATVAAVGTPTDGVSCSGEPDAAEWFVTHEIH